MQSNKKNNGSIQKAQIYRNLLVLLLASLLIAGFAFGQTQIDQKLELIVQTGHPVGITAIAFSTDGKIIASGGLNAAVKLWDVETGKELRTLKGHSREITSVTFSPDRETLATVESGDGMLILWDVRTGNKKWETQLGPGLVTFSPDGKFLVSKYGIWDTESGSVPEFIRNGESVRDQSDIGPIAMSSSGRTLAIGNEESGIKLWDLETKKEVRLLNGHSGEISSVAFSPNGKTLASGGLDNRIFLWDLVSATNDPVLLKMTKTVDSLFFSPDGKFLAIEGELWDLETLSKTDFLGEQKDIDSFSFSPDGLLLATENTQNKITIWNLATGSRRGKPLETSDATGFAQPSFSPDGQFLVYGSELWKVETGGEVRFLGDKGEIDSIAFSEDGKSLALSRRMDFQPRAASSSRETVSIELWDLAAKKELRHLRGHSEYVNSISFSPDGKILASVDSGGTVRLWNTGNAGDLKILKTDGEFIGKIAFSPDLKTLASHQMAKIGYSVKLWDVESGLNTRTFESGGFQDNLSFSHDGRFLVYGSEVWDVKTGDKWEFLKGKAGIERIEFSYDGRFLATLETAADGDSKRVLKVRNVATGADRQLEDTDISFGEPLSFSPDGRFIAASGPGYPYLILWDVTTGRISQVIEDEYERLKAWPPESVFFSPDNRVLAADRGDKHPVGLWDVATGDEIKYDRLPEWVHLSGSFAVTRINEKMIRAEGDGGQINLKDVNNRRLLAVVTALDETDWAIVAPDGRFDGSDGALNLMHYSYGLETIELEQLKDEYYEPGLLQKLLGFSNESLRAIVPLKDVKLPPYVVEQTFEPGSNKLTIKLKSRGGGIGKTEVYVNNSLSIPDARTEQLKTNPFLPGNEITTLVVDLTGSKFLDGKICESQGGKEVCHDEDVIEVVTSNHIKEIGKGNVQSRGSKSVRTAKGKDKYTFPSLYALVAGVSDYGPNTGGGNKDPLDLSFAAKDAEDFSTALSLGARRLFCPKENLNCLDKVQIKTLSTNRQEPGEQPSKENIKKAVAEIAQKAKAEDIVVIYLSGHGVSFATGTDSYFYLTQEASSTGKEDLAKNFQTVAVSNSELADWLSQTEWKPGEKGIKALKQVLILDTCAAGNFTGKDGWKTDKDLSGDQIRAMEFLKDKTGTFILMGSSANKPSYEANSFGQGLLTYALLEGMKGSALQPATNNVDVRILFDYTEKRVPALAREISITQRPIIKEPSGNNFVIGQMTVAERERITLPKSKPMMLRPLLTNPETGDDDVGLIGRLGKLLEAESSYTVVKQRGGNQTLLVYVDSASFPGAIRVTGTYAVEGDKIRIVKAFLRKDGKTIATLAEDMVFRKDEVAGELLKFVRLKLVEFS